MAASVAAARRRRRRLKLAYLRSARLARRHYFSLLSAGVLGVALGLALTSSSLDVGRPSASAQPVVAASSPRPNATTGSSPTVVTSTPELHLVVYYLVDSEAARDEVITAHHSDLADWARRGTTMEGVVHEVLVLRDAEEEAAAMVFLNDLWKLAQVEDFALHFVDLR